MFCSTCGKRIDRNGKFCSTCGATLNTVVAASLQNALVESVSAPPPAIGSSHASAQTGSQIVPAEASAKKKRRNFWLVVLALSSILVAVLAVAVALTQGFGLFAALEYYEEKEPPEMINLSENWDLVYSPLLPDENEISALFYSSVKLGLADEQHNEDGTGTATLTVVTPDLTTIYNSLLSNYQDGQMGSSVTTTQAFTDILLSSDCPQVSKTIEVTLIQDDGAWLIVADDSFNQAISGEVQALVTQFYRDYYESGANL